MVATHSIKHNGVWYKAGEEIKDKAETDNTASANFMPYTKTDINRMPTADLQKLASENGIKNADEINGTELKKLLIERFEL